jgi:hypothetical protein
MAVITEASDKTLQNSLKDWPEWTIQPISLGPNPKNRARRLDFGDLTGRLRKKYTLKIENIDEAGKASHHTGDLNGSREL